MTQSTSAVSALIDIITDPKKALAAVGENTGWLWLPLVLVILVPVSVTVYYFQTVDINWLVDQLMAAAAAQGSEIPDEARQFMTATTMSLGTVFALAVIVPTMMAITALFFHLVNKFTSANERPYGSWFALTAWASVPSVIASLAALGYYMSLGTNQITFEELQFFSVNALITHYPITHPAMQLMSAITPFAFWTVGLYTLGIMIWTKRSMMSSLIIAIIPTLAIYGVMSIGAFG
jgi:Yip1 domain